MVPLWIDLPLAAVSLVILFKWVIPKLQQLASRRAYWRLIGVWMGFCAASGVVSLVLVRVPLFGLTGALEQFLVVQVASLALVYFMILLSTRAHPTSSRSR